MSAADEITPPTRAALLRIGGRTVDLGTGEIRSGDDVVRLEPKVLEVLRQLVAHRGDTVSKEQLLATVWENTAVVDDVVWRCVAELRRAFDDDARRPRVIETLPRRGYRLIADIDRVRPPAGSPRLGWNPRLAAGLAAATLALVATLLGGAVSVSRDEAPNAAPALPTAGEEWTADDYVRLGREYYLRRDPDDLRRAFEQFERALELEPQHAGAWAGLADAAAQLSERTGGTAWVARALEASAEAIRLDPDLPEAHKSRGLALATSGRTREAIDSYRRAISLAPEFGPALGNLAVLSAEEGRFEEALTLYASLESPGTRRAVDLHNMGESLYYLGEQAEARRHYELALAIDPLQTETVASLARLDMVAGDVEAARGRIETALVRQPGDRRLAFAAARVAMLSGDLTASRRILEPVLANTPDGEDVEERVRLAWLRRRTGDPDPSALLANYEEAISAAAHARRSWRLAQLAAAVALLEDRRQVALEQMANALDHGHLDHPWLRIDPLFGTLHGDPEFESLLQRAARRREGVGQAD